MIKLEQIKKTYEKRWIKTEALRGIDLEVSDEELIAQFETIMKDTMFYEEVIRERISISNQ